MDDTPFFFHDAVKDAIVCSRHNGADGVEGRHHTVAVALAHRDLERLQVLFAQRLLCRKGGDAAVRVAVLLLIVEDAVLEVDVHALRGRAFGDRRGEFAGMQAVLGKVLEVTAGERVAVQVGGGAIPTGGADKQGVVADADAPLLAQVDRPGRADGALGHPHVAVAPVLVAALDLSGAVLIDDVRLANGSDFRIFIEAVADDGRHLFISHLVHEGRPLRIVEGHAAHLPKLDGRLAVHARGDVILASLRPIVGDILFGFIPRIGFLIFIAVFALEVFALIISPIFDGHLLFRRRRREGARQVRAGHVCIHFLGGGHIARRRVVGAVPRIFLREPCDDICPRDGILRPGDARSARFRSRQSVIAGIFDDRIIDRRDLFVRILAERDDVRASLQFVTDEAVAVRIVVVKGSEVEGVDAEIDVLRLAGAKHIRLGKVDQVDGRLFDAAVIILRGAVNFYDVLARDVAGIGDADGKFDLAVFRDDAGIGIDHFPLEVRIGEAVAEGIDDARRAVVVRIAILIGGDGAVGGDVPDGGIGQSALFRSGLVPAVTHVDALFVVHLVNTGIAAVFTRELVADIESNRAVIVDRVVGLRVGGIVLPGRILLLVYRPNVRRAAGRVDLAVEDAAEGGDTAVSHEADPDDALDIGIIFQLCDFHRRRRIDDDDDLIEVLLDVLEERLLVVLQHQGVIGRVGMSRHIVSRVIGKLGTGTREHDQRGIVVQLVRLLRICKHTDIRLDGGIIVARIDGLQLGVQVEPGIRERFRQRHRIVRRGRTGTAAAHLQVVRTDAEHADILDADIKRQHVVRVFQKNKRFVCHVLVELRRRGLLLLKRSIVRRVHRGRPAPFGSENCRRQQRRARQDQSRRQNERYRRFDERIDLYFGMTFHHSTSSIFFAVLRLPPKLRWYNST